MLPMNDPAMLELLMGGVDPRAAQRQALLRGLRAPSSPAMPQQGPQAAPRPAQRPMQAPMPVQPPQAPQADPLMSQYAALQAQQQAAEVEREQAYKPLDRSGMEAAYQKQSDQGRQGLVLALAAQEANMQPMQSHFLKQAAAAQEPMKMAGGTMTSTGFIEDPGQVQNQAIQRADAKVAQLDRALQANLTGQERRRLEAEKQQAARDLRQMGIDAARVNAQMMSGDRRYAADLAHTDRQAAAGAKAGPKTTEDQGKAAGWFVSGRQAMNDMRRVLTEDPKAGDMGFGERAATAVLPRSTGEDVANALRSPTRQQFVNAAEAMTDSLLRAATGAGVNYDEAERKRRQLIPQLGDSQAVKEQKLRNYETEMAALAARAGPALDKLPPNMGGQGNPTPPVSPVLPGGPQAGSVVDGYTFKGGNPADPKNWSK